MKTVIYKVSITTKSPINIGTGTSSTNVVKAETIKDSWGCPYIPGSTVKGLIKDNFRKLNSEDEVSYLFGEPGYKGSKIMVDNFQLMDKTFHLDIRYGNAIDRYRGAAKDGALYSKGTVTGTFQGEVEATFNEDIVKKEDIYVAIKMIEAIGSGKSRGLGKVDIHIEEV